MGFGSQVDPIFFNVVNHPENMNTSTFISFLISASAAVADLNYRYADKLPWQHGHAWRPLP
jgi:hypothetical protein